MEYSYPAVLYPDSEGIMVVFPDLNGLSVNGTDEHSAIAAAKEAMQAMLYAIKLQGAKVPVPTDLNQVNPAKVIAEFGLPFTPGTGTVKEISVNA